MRRGGNICRGGEFAGPARGDNWGVGTVSERDELQVALRPFLHPTAVAVIGASANPGKLGYGVMRNLLHPEWGFPGPVYPVNPKGGTILGVPAYPDVTDVPDPVDLAVILIPAPLVPQAVARCGERGFRGVVVVSGGFRELGEEGELLQRQVVAVARRYGMRLMGPNCIGVIDTTIPLNTTFIRSMPYPGPIAFVSQSGALCGGVVDWARARGMGFSRLYSLGNQADLAEIDFLQVLARDDHTRAICLYVEEISHGRRFYQVAREVTREKPVLLLKAGRTGAGHEAAQSHTGALAGRVAAYRAACLDAGVQWCTSLQEMFEAAQALVYNPLPRGRRVAIVTNAGGPGALAADAVAEAGLTLAHLSPDTQATLRAVLPPAAQVTPVVDMLGAAGPREYAAALRAVLADPAANMTLTIHVPQATVDPLALVESIQTAREEVRSGPLVLALPGQEGVSGALCQANRAGVPAVTFPEDAARALGHLHAQAQGVARPGESVRRPADLPDPKTVVFPFQPVLTDWDLRPVLAAYGIRLPPAALAQTPAEAARLAREVGFPVALKLMSPDLLHKSDLGGVALNLVTPEEVSRAAAEMLRHFQERLPGARVQGIEVQGMVTGGVEVIVGLVRDEQFGPLVMFGLGGVLVEALQEVSFGLAPLSAERARALVERARASVFLRGGRGVPRADVDALVDALVRLSWLGVDWPTLQALDVNPLLVWPESGGVVAVDAGGSVQAC